MGAGVWIYACTFATEVLNLFSCFFFGWVVIQRLGLGKWPVNLVGLSASWVFLCVLILLVGWFRLAVLVARDFSGLGVCCVDGG